MRKALLITTGILVVLLTIGVIGVDRYVRGLGPAARQRVIRALADRFDADVELKSLELQVAPRPTVTGEGLIIRHRGWSADRPMIEIRRFSAYSNVTDLMWQRDRVSQVTLEGLQIHLPPHGGASAFGGESSAPDKSRLRISIGKIIADGTLLEIAPKKAGKDPLVFQIQRLTLYSASSSSPMIFVAKLMNAKPPGLIDSTGTFGPWQKEDPRSTPVGGKYALQDADLSVFKGISGTLSSTGAYNGILEHIEVNGVTDTPNFALKPGGIPVDLKTRFHSIVNGTDGETILQPVDARFLNSEFICNGGVVKIDGQTAKTVDLYATTTHARMEDILKLVMGDPKPLISGAVEFRTKILIAPGPQNVIDKLALDGQFKVLSAYFASPKVASILDTLSHRARGITKKGEEEMPQQQVASNLLATFRLDQGSASFSKLSFEVPGAGIRLTGDYNLRSQRIAMAGVFRMQATLADTQSGVKHLLLKPLNPFFEKNGAGFELPLKINGDRTHPEVTFEVFHHAFTLQ